VWYEDDDGLFIGMMSAIVSFDDRGSIADEEVVHYVSLLYLLVC